MLFFLSVSYKIEKSLWVNENRKKLCIHALDIFEIVLGNRNWRERIGVLVERRFDLFFQDFMGDIK